MNGVRLLLEISQNHNGDYELAKKLIGSIARIKTDLDLYIKFCIRDLEYELSVDYENALYENENSFGKTYLEHRRNLELSDDEYISLARYAKDLGLGVGASFTNPGVLHLAEEMGVDFIKIASRDIGNVPLFRAVSPIANKMGIPAIFSTGYADMTDMIGAVSRLQRDVPECNIVIMHCVSSYPMSPEEANLQRLSKIKDYFKYCQVGFSDHSTSTLLPSLSIMLGATWIEKHITLDRNMRGSDHKVSLTPAEVIDMIRLIEETVLANSFCGLNQKPKDPSRIERNGRSLAIKFDKKPGDVITEDDLIMLSPGGGEAWDQAKYFVGKTTPIALKRKQLLKVGFKND